MKPKRGETAEETINRWAEDLIASQGGKFEPFAYERAIEMLGWLEKRIQVMRVQNT